ncbi:MAG: aminodeoxychorismate lyase [Betaproteobacteria bacterium RIFCSPLOWO2_12_FULL_62_58]|nr:MAG: aminodeoxychorismate lyase [Betaproteobacteria bacterium RIFCSPLOWO2_02_FULL_62_79]OGA51812.1 MAG: aminodeoxychorismate lyase [Betaproteobacteria bacterium RIFCSPLOWO2_12_FULL_62_58]
MKKSIKRRLRQFALLLFACAVLAFGWLAYYAYSDLKPAQTPQQFSLKAGSSLKSAAQQMVEVGMLEEPALFVILARLLGKAASIKAGNYEVDRPITPLDLLRKITEGDYTQDVITFVEGWTFRQMRKALDEHPAVRHDTQGLSDADILRRLVFGEPSPEGWFFPDTYHFSRGGSDLAILRRAHRLMRVNLMEQWERRAANLPLATPYEALILASIVEKETGRAAERPLVAAVFVNRLRVGMKLQTDPTVIYGLGEIFDGNLRKRDLVADTPYNTYMREGLPPTPIAMPGLASLGAALNPPKSDALYFVARGDGTSHFSRSLDEHDRAVTKYQKSGRR